MFDLFDKKGLPENLRVKVTPRAKKERIKRENLSDGSILYKVYVTAPAEDGKANEAVIALLANALNVAKSRLKIIRGLTIRDKLIGILND